MRKLIFLLSLLCCVWQVRGQSPGGIDVSPTVCVGVVEQRVFNDDNWGSFSPSNSFPGSGGTYSTTNTFPSISDSYTYNCGGRTGTSRVWRTNIYVPASAFGSFDFRFTWDDNIRVYIDGTQRLNSTSPNTSVVSLILSPGIHSLLIWQSNDNEPGGVAATCGTPTPAPCCAGFSGTDRFALTWRHPSQSSFLTPIVGAENYYKMPLWVKANANVNNTAGLVNIWGDNSEFGNDLSATTANRPSLNNGLNANFNFNPYISFNSASNIEFLRNTFFNGFETGTSYYYIVAKPRTNNRTEEFITSYDAATRSHFSIKNPNAIKVSINEANTTVAGQSTTLAMSNNRPSLLLVNHNAFDVSNQLMVSVNANASTAFSGDYNHTSDSVVQAGNRFYLGQTTAALNAHAFNGDIAEAILFNRNLSSTEQQKVQTYLAIKYGLTLGHNYISSSGTTIYDISGGFDKNITGIGKDIASGLDQNKSKSVEAGGLITIEPSSPPSAIAPLYFVIGDDGNSASSSPITGVSSAIGNARQMQVTSKIWQAQATNFASNVNLSMPEASILGGGTSTSKFWLVISNDPFFTALTQAPILGTVSGGVLTFSNVQFTGTKYFRIAKTNWPASVTFRNLDAGRVGTSGENTWEACTQSSVEFKFEGLEKVPNAIQVSIRTASGISSATYTTTSTPNISIVADINTGVPLSGTIGLTIPNDMVSGLIYFMNGTDTVYESPSFLVVNNPVVEVSIPAGPYCADDSFQVSAFPAGGAFGANSSQIGRLPAALQPTGDWITGQFSTASTDVAQFFGQNVFDTLSTNMDSLPINISYSFTPRYQSSPIGNCANPKTANASIVLRDNRLYQVLYTPVVAQNRPINLGEAVSLMNILDTANLRPRILFNNLQPRIGRDTLPSFSGPSVVRVGSNFRLNYGNNPSTLSYDITMQFNNRGCIASKEGNVIIIPKIQPTGLDSIYCQSPSAAQGDQTSYTFTRDMFLRDSVLLDTLEFVTGTFPRTVLKRRVHIATAAPYSNNPAGFVSCFSGCQPTYPSATPYNGETYVFTPSALPSRGSPDTIYFPYRIETKIINYTAGVPSDSIILGSSNYLAKYAIRTVSPDLPEIRGVSDNADYCSYQSDSALNSLPSRGSIMSLFNTRYTASYTLNERTTGRNDNATIVADTIIRFGNIIAAQTAAIGPGRDAPMRLIYTVSKYGCTRRDTVDFTIRAFIRNMQIGGRHTFDTVTIAGSTNNNYYCFNEPIDLLSTIPSRGTGSGTRPDTILQTKYYFFNPSLAVGPTTRVTSNQFNPNDTGFYRMTYIYWDIYQCRNEVTDTFFVKKPIPMTLAMVDNRTGYCASDTTRRSFSIIQGNSRWENVTNGAATPLPGWMSTVTRPSFTGAGVVSDTVQTVPTTVINSYFLPSANSAGVYTVSVSFRDSVNCPVNLSRTLATTPTPSLEFYGAASTSVTADIAYCRNEGIQPVYPSINSNFAPNFNGNFVNFSSIQLTGRGVVADSANRIYNYDPRLVPLTQNTDTLRFTVIDGGACAAKDSLIVRLDSVPRLRFVNLLPNYCRNASDVTLTTMPSTAPSGGSYAITSTSSGFNNVTNVLSPGTSGLGNQLITFSYSDSRGCAADTTQTFNVLDLPNANFVGLEELQYCRTALPEMANGIRPISSARGETSEFWIRYGTTTTPSILNDTAMIDPRTIPVGPATVFYTVLDSANCRSTSSQNIYINPIPVVSIVGLDSIYCKSNETRNVIGVPATSQDSIIDNRPNGLRRIATNVGEFSPILADTGLHVLSYRYQDPVTGCRDSAIFRVRVLPAIAPTITGLPSTACENRDTSRMSGTPARGNFSGTGVPFGTNFFVPTFAGRGTHIVQYTVRDTFTINSRQIVCQNVGYDTITVNALPNMQFAAYSPANNSRYCITDSVVFLMGARRPAQSTSVADSILGRSNTLNSRDTLFRGAGIFVKTDTFLNFPAPGQFVIDSTYFFQPARAGYGQHNLIAIGTNIFGCTDSISTTIFVDSIPPVGFPPLRTAYCESEPPVQVVGSPLGGTLYRDGRNITAAPTNGFFIPNPNYPNQRLSSSQSDTIKYVYQYRVGTQVVCADSMEQVVQINPVPQVSFTGGNPSNQYCLTPDSIPLTANIAGGVFTGNGIQFGTSNFAPVLAGVGNHPITYSFIDTASQCVGSFTDTITVYSQPQADFQVVGGCQDAEILFVPSVGGVSGIFQNVPFDSITQVRWKFGDLSDTSFVPSRRNVVNPITHTYQQLGTFFASLIITNQGICTDTATYRVNVVPKIDSYPYDQTFDAGTAGWLAEDINTSLSTTFEYGSPSNATVITVTTPSDRLWLTTMAPGYPPNNKSFVYSPCFDLTALDRPMIALDYWSHTLEGADGAVVEFLDENGDWSPLGTLGRGINWYNSDIIVGAPGAQTLAPIGWSGDTSRTFTNGRYMLDEVRYQQDSSVYKNFRFRVAFGSSGLQQNSLDGFAFDNVWIGNRSRNVLLEHFSNAGNNNMNSINNYVYGLIFGTTLVRDVVLIQYQTNFPLQNDEFNTDDPASANTRSLIYGLNNVPGYAVVDGQADPNVPLPSRNLTASHFEMNMLSSPKFDIEIDTFVMSNNRVLAMASVTAQQDMPQDNYRVFMTIIEDSLRYQDGPQQSDLVNAVCRQMMPSPDGTQFLMSWDNLDMQAVAETWNFNPNENNIQNMQLVVYIQNMNTFEVYQAASSRDITAFINALGVATSPAESQQFNELQSLGLFPNPTEQHFTVRFEQPLSTDYSWNLVDLHGRSIRQGNLNQGEQELQVQNLELPAGIYLFTVKNGSVYTQRKVVIYRD